MTVVTVTRDLWQIRVEIAQDFGVEQIEAIFAGLARLMEERLPVPEMVPVGEMGADWAKEER